MPTACATPKLRKHGGHKLHDAAATTGGAIPYTVSSLVNTRAKLLAAIVANPRQVWFADACKAAQLLGFVHKGGAGSHRAFAHSGESAGLNFQNHDGFIPPYQARQLIAMIEKYGEQS